MFCIRWPIALLFLTVALAPVHAQEAFPHRSAYKHVPIVELAKLRQDLDKVLLVDVRTRYEYDTLHIKGAMHIALNKTKLVPEVQKALSAAGKPVVFYCNGTTCKKSYEAAELAIKAGIKDVYAYDAGLDAWTKAYPEASVLLGRSPIAAKDLIDGAKFKRHVISAAEFDARVEKGAVVLDVRDLAQRDVALFPFKEKRAQLDERAKIDEAVESAKRESKPLLVYDKVGKQTRWLQYYLEQAGIKTYYFLDGGAEGYHEAKFGKLNLPKADS